MDKSASQISAGDLLFPSIGPFDTRMMKVSGGHRIYVEQCGNPNGIPVVVLHGGPGGGCSPAMRRFFDPEAYRIILFDQRGCGRSKPHASVENNTTWDLVADIEQIRTTLGIDRWAVFGGSWGAALALVYAQAHPDRAAYLALRGVFLMTKPELNWFYEGGAAHFWPERWAEFTTLIPVAERGSMISAYHKRLFGKSMAEQAKYARAWSRWESSLAVIEPAETRGAPPEDYARAFARLENHYFINGGFLSADQQILENMDKITNIPGTIVQGRYDMICPPSRAYALAGLWEAVQLEMIPLAGHALSEPGITSALLQVMKDVQAQAVELGLT